MLESWRQQSFSLELSVSISFDPVLRPRVNSPVMHCLIISEQHTSRSQFQHYAHLVTLDFPVNTHVMFTDDDDLWHPERSLHYAEALLAIWQQDVEALLTLPEYFLRSLHVSECTNQPSNAS